MNDPNGMVYFEGEYHLFYQYYPDSTVWGPMHWGHAVSQDLVHWEHLPIALFPDSLGMIFSGSAVIDWNNTSGLGTTEQPPMIAIFTYHDMEGEKAGKNDYETQGIAYSLDKGRTWTKYSGNPVLPNPGIKDFRDPKVFWHEETGKWILILAADDRMKLYSSINLKEWSYESDFGMELGAHGGVWECPDLFELPVEGTNQKKWVMLVSINPGGPHGGSATQYFVGDFDGYKFEQISDETRWIDYGKDNYAGVTWSDVPKEDGRRLFIGWMSNWQYANIVPTENWRSAMTVPRELKLKRIGNEVKLISAPVKELLSLRGEKTNIESKVISGEVDIALDTELLPCEVILEFEPENDSQFGNASEFGVILTNVSGEQIKVGYDSLSKEVFIDRTNSGFDDFSKEFSGKHIVKYESVDPIKMRLIIDMASVEVFVNGGEAVMTDILFPSENYSKMKMFAKNGQVKLNQGAVYRLSSIWR
jgi:fructan beta-fructosidase